MSFHENTELHVKSACLFELEKAEEWGRTYHSMHEGWAVLKEEVEEAMVDFKIVRKNINSLWGKVKGHGVITPCATLDEIQWVAIEAMKELAQVWAVCEKMRRTIREDE